MTLVHIRIRIKTVGISFRSKAGTAQMDHRPYVRVAKDGTRSAYRGTGWNRQEGRKDNYKSATEKRLKRVLDRVQRRVTAQKLVASFVLPGFAEIWGIRESFVSAEEAVVGACSKG